MRQLASLALLVTTACAAPTVHPSTTASTLTSAPAPTEAATATTAASSPAADAAILATGLHHGAMTEVILDPDGQAAITLDRDGGARLWPELRTARATPPVVLPIAEPGWISFARAGDGFVVAAVDTAGAARIGQLELRADAPRWRPLFELPATDPLLEIHVLAGGERLLVLGLDHRLRLLDRTGRAVAVLDPPGFIPWQLRLAHVPGRDPAIVAVLADPVRVRPIVLRGDSLALGGEARQVALDLGPNHNDLALAPDGSFVTALRRPRSKGKGWQLERIVLATGERSYLAGEIDSTVRPRVHLVDAGRILLESGSGKGHWIDLLAAVVPQPGAPFDRSKLPLTPATAIVDLPGSSADSRMQSTTAAGLRVVVVGDALIADPLADDHHIRFAADAFEPTRVALDGARLAFIADGRLFTETLADPSPPRALGAVDYAIDLFLDRDLLLVVASPNELTLRRWADGAVVDTARTREPWGLRGAAYHAEADGRARVAVAGRALVEFSVGADGLGEPQTASDASWPELRRFLGATGAPLAAKIHKHTGDRVEANLTAAAQDREYLYPAHKFRRLYQLRGETVQAIEHFRGSNELLVPSPATARVAVVDHAVIRPRFQFVDAVREPDPVATVTVIDFAGDTPRALWSRSFRAPGLDLAWSADGARLAVAGDGGHVFDATSGAQLWMRRDLGLSARREPDARPSTDGGSATAATP